MAAITFANRGGGLAVRDEVGPFLDMVESKFNKHMKSVVNAGLFYVSDNAKADLMVGRAGDTVLPKVQSLRKKISNIKANKRLKKKGYGKDQIKSLAAQRNKLKRDKGHNLTKSKKFGTMPYLARAIRYTKMGQTARPAVGWVGPSSLRAAAKGVYFQTGGSTIVTKKMKRYFFAIGVGLTKSKIDRPHRDIWNNVYRKYVRGGGMQERMEQKLQDKIDGVKREIKSRVKTLRGIKANVLAIKRGQR